MKNIIFRKATNKDISFLIDIIIEAEKSGTQRLSYSAIFELSEKDVRRYLNEILSQEIEGSGELSISSYMVAEKNDQIIAGACAWVENSTKTPTAILKGNLINFTFPRENIKNSFKLHPILHQLHFDYNTNVIHMGAGFVTKENRGQNLLMIIKQKQLEQISKNNPTITEAFVDTFECSKAALRTSEKLGFELVEIKEANDDEILRYLPSKKKLLLKKKMN